MRQSLSQTIAPIIAPSHNGANCPDYRPITHPLSMHYEPRQVGEVNGQYAGQGVVLTLVKL